MESDELLLLDVFTTHLKTKRLHSGMSQDKLSELSGVSIETISRTENNKTNPLLTTFIQLAIVLEIDVNEILEKYKQQTQ
ncbi:MAG TPA: helix-turn-helix transcriptional regulator [Pseudogracilibacillus sp.]|nr:helix-turn-helix transcriptional regulator [Pseudogracilibacillus sp.]